MFCAPSSAYSFQAITFYYPLQLELGYIVLSLYVRPLLLQCIIRMCTCFAVAGKSLLMLKPWLLEREGGGVPQFRLILNVGPSFSTVKCTPSSKDRMKNDGL